MSDAYQSTLAWARRLSPAEQLALIAALSQELQANAARSLDDESLDAEAQRILQARRNSLSQGKGEELPGEMLYEGAD